MKRAWFRVVLVVSLGIVISLVLSLVASQITFVGPDRPLKAFGKSDVRQAILASLFCATTAAALALLLAIPAAYALARYDFRGKRFLDALIDVPAIMSPVALGLSLLLVFRSSPGRWVENYLMRFIFEIPGVVLAQFVLALALSVRILKAAFEEVSPRLEQVARFMGATPFQAFRHVALPLGRPGLLAAFIVGWARAMGDFGATVTIGGAVRGKTETMPVSIYLNMAAANLDQAIALMVALTAVALVVLVLLRYLRRKTA